MKGRTSGAAQSSGSRQPKDSEEDFAVIYSEIMPECRPWVSWLKFREIGTGERDEVVNEFPIIGKMRSR